MTGRARYEPKHLDRLLSFTVDTEDDGVEMGGAMAVSVSEHGIDLRWSGAGEPFWSGTWTDFRCFVEGLRDLSAEIAEAETHTRVLEEVRREIEAERAAARMAELQRTGVVTPISTAAG